MAEPMSEERLAVCRDLPQLIRRHTWTAAEDAADAIRDLTVEVQRLRAQLAAEHLATEAAETENDRLRAQLAEIGETHEEWGVRRTWNESAEIRTGYAICETEEHARSALEHYLAVDRFEQNPVECALVKRLAGEWREVQQ